MELRPYQNQALSSVVENEAAGVTKQLIVSPTGSGKTVIMAGLIKMRPKSTPCLVLAHREELLHQARDKILAVNPDLVVEIEQAGNKATLEADVVVASVPTLGRKNSPRREKYPPDHFKLIIVDEAHHAAAESYKRVLGYFKPDLLLGVTATPQRGDNVRLSDVFDKVVFYKSMLDLINEGFLCNLVGYKISSDTLLDNVPIRAGDYADKQLEEVIDNETRNQLIVDSYKTHLNGKRALAFCAGVAHAKNLSEKFIADGIPTACVVGTTDSDERKQTLADLKSGKIKVVTNVGVLTEGFDESSIEGIILARPTQSPLLLTQICGRGTRLHPGKEHCILIDISDTTSGKKPVGIPSLVGLPPQLGLHGDNLVKAAKQYQKLYDTSPQAAAALDSIDDIQVAWDKIDLFAPPELSPVVEEHSRYVWFEIGVDSFQINLDDSNTLFIEHDPLGDYQVKWHHEGDARYGKSKTELIKTTAVLATAFVSADNWIQENRKDIAPLLAQDAHWRADGPSEKQQKFLARIGIPITNTMTKGDASALISDYINKNPRSQAQKKAIAWSKTKQVRDF